MRWVRRVLLAVCVAVAVPTASADFTATFEAPDYTGSAAGTVLTGQQGWYLPAGVNAHVYTYASNALGLTAVNPTGGDQFGAGLRLADYVRAQHDYSFVGGQVVLIGYDSSCSFFAGRPPTSGWCGSISLQPSGSSQSIMSMREWTTNAPPAYQIKYGVYTNPAAPTTSSWTPVVFGNLPTNHWFREEILIDFGAHRIVEVALTDLETSVRTVYTAPTNWYLRGGPNPTEPLPTGLRFFTGIPDNNILAYDNVTIDAALVSNAEGATDGGWSEWAADTEVFATRAYDNDYDDLESYAIGSQIADQGNWIWWDNDPNNAANGGALVTNAVSLSGTNALEAGGIGGVGSGINSDVVWQYGPLTNGTWTVRTRLYVPSTSTNGSPRIRWLRNHPAEGDAVAGMSFDLVTGLVEGGPAGVVRDQWTEVSAVLRVDDQAFETYYDGSLIEQGTWTGLQQVNGLSLRADNPVGAGVAPVYFDDLSAERMYIKNTNVTDVTATSATLNGQLMAAKGATEVWLYWGSADGGTDPNAWENAIFLGTQSVGLVSVNLTDLVGSSRYYYRYFADSLSWDDWAHQTATFETLFTPTAENLAATLLANGTARLRGRFPDQNRGDITICWGMSDGGTNAAAWDYVVPIGTQASSTFSTDVSDLLFPNTYYYTCYATNAYGDDWADTSTNFVTLGPRPEFNTSGSLDYGLYNGAADTELSAIDDGLANGRNGGLFALTPTSSQKWTGEVWQQGNTADYYCQMWWGYFLPPVTGNYAFDVHGDDYEALWIDTDISGEFERATDLVSDNTPESGEGWNTPHTETVYLESGIGYAIAIAHNEGTGGDWFNLTVTPPAGSARRINPGAPDQTDWWWDRYVVQFSSLGITNEPPADVTADSATLRGRLSSTASIYDAWVLWGPTNEGTNDTAWANRAYLGTYTNASGVALAHPISGLSIGATTYYTFCASNALYIGCAAPSVVFQTVDAPPVVENLAAITEAGSATLRGRLTTGNAADVAIYWGRSDGGTNMGAWDSVVLLDDTLEGSFSGTVNAGYGDTYYSRCYATNVDGDAWAASTASFALDKPETREPGLPVTNGLLYHLDAALGITKDASDNVSRWADQSAAGNDFVQTTANKQPLWLSSSISGRPAIQFDGSDEELLLSTTTAPETFVAVTRVLTGGDLRGIWGNENNDKGIRLSDNDWYRSVGHGSDGNDFPHSDAAGARVNGATTAGYTVGEPHIIAEFRGPNHTGNYPYDDTSIGEYFGGRGYHGDIGELMVYGRDLTETELDEVGGYLSWKYGISTLYPEYTPPQQGFGIDNEAVSDVAADAVTLNCSVSATGWVFDVYAYWGTTNGGTVAANWATNAYVGAITNDAGILSYRASGLPADTGHYYTFRATNDVTNLWAEQSAVFRTLGSPVVSNTPATDITQTAATLNGDLVRGGTGEATIYWGLADGGTTPSAWGNTSVVGTVVGPFGNTVEVLAGGTYYYRCYVTNSMDDDWADSAESFAAESAQVSLDIAVNMPDLGLSPTNVSGCVLWIAGDDIDGDGDTGNNPSNGTPVNVWADKSGLDHDVTRVGLVDPSLTTNGPNGRPVVTFDSDRDYMATAYNFDPHTEYTIFSVARYTGGDNERVISSATRNWLFGFHGNGTERWHAEGWIYAGPTGNADANWHIHAGHINSEADPRASFWADGLLQVAGSTGSGAGNHMIGRLALGGYRDNNEESNCEIAEILIFDRVLTGGERQHVGLYLDNKYGLKTAYSPVTETRGSFTATTTLSEPAISNVTVNFAFGGGAAAGRLTHTGYHVQPQADMDLNNNGGLMALVPYGTTTLTVGPGGRGLDFNNDTDFINSGAINQADNYMNLFLGYFNPQETGTFQFRNAGDDDRGGIWLDLDQDGVFESTTPGLGSDRGEQLSWEDGAAKSVTLTNGLSYRIAFTHGEYGGGSRCDFRFKAPSMAAEAIVKPSDPAQYGMWAGSTNATTYPADYTCDASVVIPAGSLSASVTLTPVDDLDQEEDEGGTISIDSVVHAVIGSPDRASFVISSEDPKVENGPATDVADGTATLNGTLTMGDDATVAVYWGTSDGGTNNSLWEATNVVGYAAEDEPLSVVLTDLTGGQTYYYRWYATNSSNLGEDWAGTTTNFTTAASSLGVDDISVEEGDSGSVAAVFTVSLSAPTIADVTADYATVDGSATVADGDYAAVSGSLRIPAGSVSTQITVLVHGDTLTEHPPETFGLQLSTVAGGAGVGNNPGTCAIVDDDASTYLASRAYRMQITFSGYTGGETLTNWPALVRFGEAIPGFLYDSFGSSTGGDLRFADGDVKRLLSFEIESWDTDGESAVWVQVPELSGSNTSVWACWGHPSDTSLPSYATDGSTWDETFAAVFHLADGAKDSSANGNDGTPNGNPTASSTAMIGLAQDLDGDDRFRSPDAPSIDLVGPLTLSGWFRARSQQQWSGLISKGNDNSYEIENGRGAANYRMRLNNDQNAAPQINTWALSTWYYIVGTYDRKNTRLYRDGVLGNERAMTAPLNQNNNELSLGDRSNNLYFNGQMDEWRVSNVARSADWVMASYLNQVKPSTFTEYGPTLSRPGTVLIVR